MDKYYVFVGGVHDYTIEKKEKKSGKVKYTLSYSNAEHWNEPYKGNKSITIIDDDLEMKIKGIDGVMPYAKVCELNILLSFVINNYENEKYEIVSAKSVILKQ